MSSSRPLQTSRSHKNSGLRIGPIMTNCIFFRYKVSILVPKDEAKEIRPSFSDVHFLRLRSWKECWLIALGCDEETNCSNFECCYQWDWILDWLEKSKVFQSISFSWCPTHHTTTIIQQTIDSSTKRPPSPTNIDSKSHLITDSRNELTNP